jgi:hypothetical protein
VERSAARCARAACDKPRDNPTLSDDHPRTAPRQRAGPLGFDARICRVGIRIEVVKDSGIGYEVRVNRY